jgi:hypothetical protein
MTMNANTKLQENAVLELHSLEDHELGIVSGGTLAQRPFDSLPPAMKGDFGTYEIWGMLGTVNSPVKLAHWVGVLGH